MRFLTNSSKIDQSNADQTKTASLTYLKIQAVRDTDKSLMHSESNISKYPGLDLRMFSDISTCCGAMFSTFHLVSIYAKDQTAPASLGK